MDASALGYPKDLFDLPFDHRGSAVGRTVFW